MHHQFESMRTFTTQYLDTTWMLEKPTTSVHADKRLSFYDNLEKYFKDVISHIVREADGPSQSSKKV